SALAVGSCGDNGGLLGFFCARRRRVAEQMSATVRPELSPALLSQVCQPPRCVCEGRRRAPKNKVKARAHAPRRSGPAMTPQMRRSTPSVARVGPVPSALRRRDGEAVNTPATRLPDVSRTHSRSSAGLCPMAWRPAAAR
ncbi:uncharacterized protein Tco025E_09834, partial [Trypanosoma conorhini]